MKKIINNPRDVVEEAIEGYMYAYNDSLTKVENVNGIIRKDLRDKVAIVTGEEVAMNHYLLALSEKVLPMA
ncbi:hypothetical protein ACI2OX_04525 [Bacillus sp. N9]